MDMNSPFKIGSLVLANRLVQGPLAGFSCAPFRQLFYQFIPPAYCVSEMISATDVLHKHTQSSRYLYRAPEETRLCYQLSGQDPAVMADAAQRLQALGADLIDINAGCPKPKIRKKGAGSALLETPDLLVSLVHGVREAIQVPLTVKLRLQKNDRDLALAQSIEQAGADALIIHGRCWTDDYDTPSDLRAIAAIKQSVGIPVIANGDMLDRVSLDKAIAMSGCDAYMIARGGCGKPWLYQALLTDGEGALVGNMALIVDCFLQHLDGLAALENEYQAVLQSKALARYYFRGYWDTVLLQDFYRLEHFAEIKPFCFSALSALG